MFLKLDVEIDKILDLFSSSFYHSKMMFVITHALVVFSDFHMKFESLRLSYIIMTIINSS